MSVVDEIRRLDTGPFSNEQPGGIGTIALLGLCDGDAGLVAKRTSEVLRVALAASSEHWPTEPEWRNRLPDWFLDACAPEMTQEEAERWVEKWRSSTPEQRAKLDQTQQWALADWLHWFQPSERQWELWECRDADENCVRLTIKVDGWPVAHGALDWLLRAAGADRVVTEDED